MSDLERELKWLAEALELRFQQYFALPDSPLTPRTLSDLPPPEFETAASPWAAFLAQSRPSLAERLALGLALAPLLRPQLLDFFFTKNATFDRRFAEFGGNVAGDTFEPTVETLAFVLGGASIAARVDSLAASASDSSLVAGGLLRDAAVAGEHRIRMPLRLTEDAFTHWVLGERRSPDFGAEFPAQLVETGLDWEDLVLHPGTLRRVQEIETFIRHGRTLMEDWGMRRHLRPGFRALFYGPPGTGKTLTAALLGKLTKRSVFRIDLSLVVSKYIGETEKNLARLLDRAQRADMILFFDEADALFGKRTEMKDAHDMHANQQVAYLLQRIETFDGIAILASNLKDNLDGAFARRFESVIYFPLPGPEERLRLWRGGWSSRARLDPDIDLEAIAQQYKLSGGDIINIIRIVSLAAVADGQRAITGRELQQAVRRELMKEGRA